MPFNVRVLHTGEGRADNRAMPGNAWQRRIARAEELGARYPFAAEILRFYGAIVRFQQDLSRTLESLPGEEADAGSSERSFSHPVRAELIARFRPFLAVVEKNGPAPLAAASRELGKQGDDSHAQLLDAFWQAENQVLLGSAEDFFARSFLQPYAEFLRSQHQGKSLGYTPCLCPFCNRKPVMGVLRQLGEGGQRFLTCSFCLNEWEFRRIVCPGCGEENHAKLPIYTAEELQHVRVECCDSCRSYIKTVDLTQNGLAEPIVDEMASIPLDLWAQRQGYSKLQTNLMQL
jgi:FdhE protein